MQSEPSEKRREPNREFVDKALLWLPTATMVEALDFYESMYHAPGCDDWALAQVGRGDRFFLLTHLLGRSDLIHPWLYDRCREVEREPDDRLDLWAREHGKSSIITFGGVIQETLKDPELTTGIFSHTGPDAKKFLFVIKQEFEGNATLKALYRDILWGNPKKDAPLWSLDEGIIVKRKGNPREATVEAHGLIDGMPTGKHFALLVYDDVVTEKSVTTPEQVFKATSAWELSDNLGKIGGRKWHIGTRYSYADTYQAIIERKACIERTHPATHNGKIDGKPVFFPQETWDKKVKAQGEATISCQMLQNPLAGKQRMFDIADFQEYEVRPATLNVYLLIDPARSKKKDSAKTAMALVGVDYAGNKYLLDGFNHRMDLQERWQRMKELYSKWAFAPGVQSCRVGYEEYGAQADFDYFRERMAVEKCSIPIDELNWPREGDGSKVDRVQRLVPDLKNKRIYLPYPTDDKRLTSMQQGMKSGGHEYRIARPIKRLDDQRKIYDVSEDLKIQAHYFPYGSYKDLIDAFARIYDIEASPPVQVDPGPLEPIYT